MDLLEIVLLAVLQGLTEFLPISSAAHLILLPRFADWPDQGLAFDVAVHFGSLVAVVIYFRRELHDLAFAWVRSVAGGPATPDSRLAWGVLVGTIPVGLGGLLFYEVVENHLRVPLIIAATTAFFGVLLWWSDLRGRRVRDEHQMVWHDMLLIGLAQALALVPGTSRSGITMTAGLMLGLTRSAAARYSFLLSVLAIGLASSLQSVKLMQSSEPVNWSSLGLAAAVSAGSAYLCIDLFLKFLERTGMWPFAIYRVLLGGVIVVVFL